MKRLMQFFLTIILYAILPFVVVTMITSKTDILGGIRSFVVLTGSMEPALPVGSIVYTQKNPGYHSGATASPVDIQTPQYSTGDVVAFDQGGRTVTHRIVGVEENDGKVQYKTRGDANNTDDSDMVPQSKVIGKHIASLPYLGKLVGFLKTLPGFISLIIVPGALFIGYELWNIKKEIEKQTEKKVLAKMQSDLISSES